MKKFISILIAGVVMLSSCEKAFDVKNTGSLTGTQASEIMNQDPSFLTSYVNGLYSWMVQFNTSGQSNPHDDYGHLGVTHILDLMGQDIAINGTWNWGKYDIPHDYGMYTWARPYHFWNFYFTLINKCNEVINFFGEEDPNNPETRGYLGQAYALRAFAYTYLIQIFQDPVDGTTPNATIRTSAPAVPIIYAARDGKSAEEIDSKGGRNTIADVMEEIERNIALALPLLDGYDRGTVKNYVNYEVAQGIAARYYLLTQQWDKAIKASQAAQNGFDVMDKTRLKSGFMEIQDAEVLWGFDHSTETMTSYASFFSHVSNDCTGYGGIGQSVHCIDASLYNQIPDTDYRKGLFNTAAGDPKAATTGAKLPYATRKFGYAASWLQDYIFMRNSEMILIEAEAHARLNDGEAKTALAKLMAKRDPSWSPASVSVEDVLLQRRIELWCEGFEYFDIRRNGLGANRKYEGTNHTPAAQYHFPAHGKSWNFQIPNSELQNNPKITEEEQNEWVSGLEEYL